MYSFRNDYSEGAHPKVLQALMDTNLEQTVAYGTDPRCETARETIRQVCAVPNADVHFLVGGTQTNLLVIESLLRPYEAVIAAHTAHVNTHETGAIEATGHKVCSIYSPDGKLTPALVEMVLAEHNGTEHMVAPRLVYVSDTTEIGTIYTKAELQALRACCDRHGLLLFLDGARLGSALTSPENDLTLPDLAALTDAFYIGGTKNGALFGEALVMNASNDHFRWHMKQRGGMLAKGRLLGIQFETLFEDGLYFEICKQAVDYALEIRRAFEARGIPMFGTSATNQQFAILTAQQQAAFAGQFASEYWGDAGDGRSIVRFCTSWATTRENVDALLNVIDNL